jgi:hypothetical protein
MIVRARSGLSVSSNLSGRPCTLSYMASLIELTNPEWVLVRDLSIHRIGAARLPGTAGARQY